MAVVSHATSPRRGGPERTLAAGRQIEVRIDAKVEAIPGLLLVPNESAPAPAALLLHGLGSTKEVMVESIGRALLHQRIASLAIDLPLHGARRGRVEDLSLARPLAVLQAWRQAIADARGALDFLARQPEVQPERIALVGYSLGAFLGVLVSANDSRVRAVVLASGGDFPADMPFAPLIRRVADPLRAVRKLAGRPVLMVNGRQDRTVHPAQARLLFDAAAEPKEIVWYHGGHWPPATEIERAAKWLDGVLRGDPAGMSKVG